MIVDRLPRHQRARGATADGLRAIQDATNVEALVAAMRTHREDAELQHWACHTLGYMAQGNADNRAKASNVGAVEAVVAAMSTHIEGRAATCGVPYAWSLDYRQRGQRGQGGQRRRRRGSCGGDAHAQIKRKLQLEACQRWNI
jgi:hypothetical protein